MGSPTGKAAPALPPLQLGTVVRIDFKVQTWYAEGHPCCPWPRPNKDMKETDACHPPCRSTSG